MLGIITWLLLITGGIIATNALTYGMYKALKTLQDTAIPKGKSSKVISQPKTKNTLYIHYLKSDLSAGDEGVNSYNNAANLKLENF